MLRREKNSLSDTDNALASNLLPSTQEFPRSDTEELESFLSSTIEKRKSEDPFRSATSEHLLVSQQENHPHQNIAQSPLPITGGTGHLMEQRPSDRLQSSPLSPAVNWSRSANYSQLRQTASSVNPNLSLKSRPTRNQEPPPQTAPNFFSDLDLDLVDEQNDLPTHITPNEVAVSNSISVELSALENSPNQNIKKKVKVDTQLRKPVNHRTKSETSLDEIHISSGCTAAALSFVGGVGGVVEKIFSDINRLALCNDDDHYPHHSSAHSFSRVESNATLGTLGEDIRDDMSKLERMTSWDTHDTLTTIGTINTAATNEVSISPSLPDYQYEASAALPELDDDGNRILAEVLKAHQTRKEHASKLSREMSKREEELPEVIFSDKKKQKKQKRKKVVKFDYPPISALRECPRITDEERDALFFTEDELDQYDSDRRHNLNDDVEVVAVHASESESEVSDDSDSDADIAADEIEGRRSSSVDVNSELRQDTNHVRKAHPQKTALRDGRWTTNKRINQPSYSSCDSSGLRKRIEKPQHSTTKTNTPEGAKETIEPRSLKYNNRNDDDGIAKYQSTDSEDTYKKRGSQKRNTQTKSSSEETSKKGGRGKLKGVQIYLRQRTVQ